MLTAEFLIPLPSGELIRYEEVFSPFDIYSITGRNETFLLLPKKETKGFEDFIIIANHCGIRICRRTGYPLNLSSKIKNIIVCKANSAIIKTTWKHIPTYIQNTVCSQLVKAIKYQSITK